MQHGIENKLEKNEILLLPAAINFLSLINGKVDSHPMGFPKKYQPLVGTQKWVMDPFWVGCGQLVKNYVSIHVCISFQMFLEQN